MYVGLTGTFRTLIQKSAGGGSATFKTIFCFIFS